MKMGKTMMKVARRMARGAPYPPCYDVWDDLDCERLATTLSTAPQSLCKRGQMVVLEEWEEDDEGA